VIVCPYTNVRGELQCKWYILWELRRTPQRGRMRGG
jgi:hypothetical protein